MYLMPAIALLLLACEGNSEHVFSGNTMGTSYTVKIIEDNITDDMLAEQIGDELQRINSLMSTYDQSSELSMFNQAPEHIEFPVSTDVIKVLEMSGMIHDQSDGAFDVSVGPLVNLWGFGPRSFDDVSSEKYREMVPADDEINEAMSRTGFHFLKVTDSSLIKSRNIYVDLSAIAKGYAVDQLAIILDRAGHENYLIEVGGEIRGRGINVRHEPWAVAIEKPDNLSRSIFKIIELRDMSMATSGDYRNYFEADGVRYSHTIDPRTGRPITHNVVSVTVVTESAALADAYATAIDVMGADEGLALAEAQKLAVLVIMKTSAGFEERSSSQLRKYLELDGPEPKTGVD